VYEEHFFISFLIEKKGLMVNTGYTEKEQVGRLESGKKIQLVVKDNIPQPTQGRRRGKRWDERKD
jgi:hypothetical protein